MITGHGGNIYALARELACEPADIMDMSSNVNPLGPPENLVNHLIEHIDAVNALPEVDAHSAVSAFAASYGLDPARVSAGNGTTQFIYTLPMALGLRSALILGPTYADYADACSMHGTAHRFLNAEAVHRFTPDMDRLRRQAAACDAVFICNPNNPTGALIPAADIRTVCRQFPDTLFVVDESYLPFATDGEQQSVAAENAPNLIVLNSMSKIFRIPGLRIGFLIAPEAIAAKFNHYALPWSANSLAQLAVVYLMTQTIEINKFIQITREFISREKERFQALVADIEALEVFPSTTGFVLLQLHGRRRSAAVCAALAAEKILIRDCANFHGLSDRFIRIAFKTEAVNTLLAERLHHILKG